MKVMFRMEGVEPRPPLHSQENSAGKWEDGHV